MVPPVTLVRMPFSSPNCGLSTYCQMTATATADVSTGMKKTVRSSGRSRRAAASIMTARGQRDQQVEGQDDEGEDQRHDHGRVEGLGQLGRVGEVEELLEVLEADERVVATEPSDARDPSRRGL